MMMNSFLLPFVNLPEIAAVDIHMIEKLFSLNLNNISFSLTYNEKWIGKCIYIEMKAENYLSLFFHQKYVERIRAYL